MIQVKGGVERQMVDNWRGKSVGGRGEGRSEIGARGHRGMGW